MPNQHTPNLFLSDEGRMDRSAHIANLFRAGKSQRAISRIIGISQPAVRKWLLKLQLITAPPVADHHQPVQSAEPLTPHDNLVEQAPDPVQPPAATEAGLSPAPVGNRLSLSFQRAAAALVPCEWCGRMYPPGRAGQRFCCNGCGHRGQGLSPLVEHEEGCPVLQQKPQE